MHYFVYIQNKLSKKSITSAAISTVSRRSNQSISYGIRKLFSRYSSRHGIQLQYNEPHTNDLIQQYRTIHVHSLRQLYKMFILCFGEGWKQHDLNPKFLVSIEIWSDEKEIILTLWLRWHITLIVDENVNAGASFNRWMSADTSNANGKCSCNNDYLHFNKTIANRFQKRTDWLDGQREAIL